MEIAHDPDARLDYAWDWDDWLAVGETITNHAISMDPVQPADGVIVESSGLPAGNRSVVAWLTGGKLNTSVDVTCHIVTSAGREDDRTMSIWVKKR